MRSNLTPPAGWRNRKNKLFDKKPPSWYFVFMDNDFIDERITATASQIAAYEDAALELAGGAQSYTLDTGQSRQTVTKSDLSSIQATIDSLYNRYVMLKARRNGSGVINVRPAF